MQDSGIIINGSLGPKELICGGLLVTGICYLANRIYKKKTEKKKEELKAFRNEYKNKLSKLNLIETLAKGDKDTQDVLSEIYDRIFDMRTTILYNNDKNEIKYCYETLAEIAHAAETNNVAVLKGYKLMFEKEKKQEEDERFEKLELQKTKIEAEEKNATMNKLGKALYALGQGMTYSRKKD